MALEVNDFQLLLHVQERIPNQGDPNTRCILSAERLSNVVYIKREVRTWYPVMEPSKIAMRSSNNFKLCLSSKTELQHPPSWYS
jgi:hypothetical protein